MYQHWLSVFETVAGLGTWSSPKLWTVNWLVVSHPVHTLGFIKLGMCTLKAWESFWFPLVEAVVEVVFIVTSRFLTNCVIICLPDSAAFLRSFRISSEATSPLVKDTRSYTFSCWKTWYLSNYSTLWVSPSYSSSFVSPNNDLVSYPLPRMHVHYTWWTNGF